MNTEAIHKVMATAAKGMAIGLVAAGLAMATPAQAQHVTFGVQLGGPFYVGHDGYREGYDREQYEAYCRQQAFLRQQEYIRQQAYARQQAYLQHEAWEQHERHEAWEHGDRRDFHHDGVDGFRGNDARYDGGSRWDRR